MKTVKTVNIKIDMPSVEEARKRLADEIKKAKSEGWMVIKLVHGYGSTGVGGKLRDALRKSLALRRKEGLIKAFLYGERWNIFEEEGRRYLESCPELRRDHDLNSQNEGITLLLL